MKLQAVLVLVQGLVLVQVWGPVEWGRPRPTGRR